MVLSPCPLFPDRHNFDKYENAAKTQAEPATVKDNISRGYKHRFSWSWRQTAIEIQITKTCNCTVSTSVISSSSPRHSSGLPSRGVSKGKGNKPCGASHTLSWPQTPNHPSLLLFGTSLLGLDAFISISSLIIGCHIRVVPRVLQCGRHLDPGVPTIRGGLSQSMRSPLCPRLTAHLSKPIKP